MTNLSFIVRPTMTDFVNRFNKISSLTESTLIFFMWRGYEQIEHVSAFLDNCRSLGMNIKFVRAGNE